MLNVPAGAYLELNLDLIDEGNLRVQADNAIRKAVAELLDYEKQTEDRGQSAEITVKLKIRRAKNANEHFEVTHTTAVKVPTPKRTSIVKEANGRLLCQPNGSSASDPDQMVFFDRHGRQIAHEEEVAGRIGRKAAE
jgi:hypothetical protein